MCGIVGMIGTSNVVSVLVEGLRRLEYRGYDSTGIAVGGAEGIQTRKAVGRLAELEGVLGQQPLDATLGIGHTRWATHGEASERNCHPHLGGDLRLAMVHNGIIENYMELKADLSQQGVVFQSETDTEVLAQFIDQETRDVDFVEGLRSALQQARGAYAIGLVTQEEPQTLYGARSGSPLIVGKGPDGLFIASDVPAILPQVEEVIYLEDGEVARLTPSGVEIWKLDGTSMEPKWVTVEMEEDVVDSAGFETFMLKEIHEQTRVLRSLTERYVEPDGGVALPELDLSSEQIRSLNRILIVSCGTAYYAAMYGRLLIEQFTSIAVETDLGSEFRYRSPKIEQGTLVAAVSQSGETADTLASVKMAKQAGCPIVSICNVVGSSLVRESDHLIYTHAGPEIGVASTKAFTAQLMCFVLLTLKLAEKRGELSLDQRDALLAELKRIPSAIHHVLEGKEAIQEIASRHHDGPSSLYLGRRFNYPIAMEGALKNKEISYQHAEGYAAGEMKHGPIALINESLPVICICTRTEDEVDEKVISNMREVQARSGRIIAVATEGETRLSDITDDIIYVPATLECLSPLVNVVALQLLAYYAAQARGTDIDKPRNLAKSVTVE